jgi:hypothetical protein
LKGYLKGKNVYDIEGKQRAYDCAKTVYEEPNQDYYVVKNMTHLLLDLDTSVHFFDTKLHEEKEFFKLGLDFGRKLLHHPECMKDFDEKDELECRCPHLMAKIIIWLLLNL